MSTDGIATTHPVEHLDDQAEFQADEERSVLDCGLESGVDMAYGCRSGVCGACAVVVVEGLESLDEADPIEENSIERFELEPGVRLACRIRAKAKLVIKTLP